MIGRLGLVSVGAVCLALVGVGPGALSAQSVSADIPQAAAAVRDQELPGAPLNPYTPPACVGMFSDVPCPGGFAVNWIEQFYSDQITSGCGTNPLTYCPDAPVKRSEMAVFVEKAMHGTWAWSPGDLGYYNTGLGAGALQNNGRYSQYNTAVGTNALARQSFANGNLSYYASNTAVGVMALYDNQPDGGHSGSSGTNNTAVGVSALTYNVTGYSNTAIGVGAGVTNISGLRNTFVGMGADVDNYGRVNATAIGYGAVVDSSYKVRIGNADVSIIEGAVAWSFPSDARLKADIRDLDLGLDLVMRLRPVSFTMRRGNGRTDMGFVAQDVEAVLGDGYNVLGIGGDEDRTLSLRATDLIAPMVKAIQEQQAQITDQAKAIQGQQEQIESRDARIAALETRLAGIEERLTGK
jgi:hypothetical protein